MKAGALIRTLATGPAWSVARPSPFACGGVPRRGIQSTWGLEQQFWNPKGNPLLTIWKERVTTKYFSDSHAVERAPEYYTQPGRTLLAELEQDIKDLLAADWTLDFNPYWIDQLARHHAAYKAIIRPGALSGSLFLRLFFEAYEKPSEEEMTRIENALGRFDSIMEYACRTEACFSEIYGHRFAFQRHEPGCSTWMDMERLLCEGTDKVLALVKEAPSELAPKIQGLLEFHLFANRHWVHENPNVKAVYPD
eukprot:223301_1